MTPNPTPSQADLSGVGIYNTYELFKSDGWLVVTGGSFVVPVAPSMLKIEAARVATVGTLAHRAGLNLLSSPD